MRDYVVIAVCRARLIRALGPLLYMKRRITKKRIRHEERMIAKALRDYKSEFDIDNDDLRMPVQWRLEFLADWYISLKSSEVFGEYWTDGIGLESIKEKEPHSFYLEGYITWGLVSDIGGHQWDEPFEAVVNLSRKEERLVSYRLKFSDGKRQYLFSKRG